MALPTFTEDMDIIQALGDRPNTDDGLTPTQLKAKFDLAGNKIKTFLNSTLIPRLLEKPSFAGLVKSNYGTLYAAVPGVDYQSPMTPGVDYQAPMTPGVDYQTPLVANTDYLTPTKAAEVYEPIVPAEEKRRIFFGTESAEDYYAAHDLTPELGDIYIRLPGQVIT